MLRMNSDSCTNILKCNNTYSVNYNLFIGFITYYNVYMIPSSASSMRQLKICNEEKAQMTIING